ncbi:MAG: acyloxyacyl hydrolase [Rickettsiales bacterium]
MKIFAAALLTTTIIAAPALAQNMPTWAKGHIVPYVGAFDALDDDKAFVGGIEYRASDLGYGIRPVVGGFANEDSDAYGYAGIVWDLHVADEWVVTPSFAVGAYHHGAGKDLGGALEFKSGIEVSYVLPDDYRIGVQLNHLSNASIYDKNPGEENLIATFQIPTSW